MMPGLPIGSNIKSALAAVAAMAICGAASADAVSDIPLEKCTPGQVLMTIHYSATKRELPVDESNLDRWHRLQELTNKHPKAGTRPIAEILNKSELEVFNRISDQIAVANYYLLAESRLKRDALVLMDMVDAATNLRDGKALPDAKAPQSRPYNYLAVLRELLKEQKFPEVKIKEECSFNLALERESDRTRAAARSSLDNSPELKELLALREKYHLSDGANFAATKLSQADATRLNDVQPKVARYITSNIEYIKTLDNLKYLGDVVRMQYEAQKSDALQVGPTKDMSEFDKLQKARFQSLAPHIQKIVNFWYYIDAEIPSEQTKTAMSIVEIYKQNAPKR